MLYILAEQLGFPGILNLIRYISFRAGAATATALLIGLLIGPAFINWLRAKQGKGQPIRADGPQSHLAKRGTPTMGGLMILISVGISVLLWMDLANPYVWACLLVTAGFGLIGFLDDYDKVKKAHHAGLKGRTRLLLEFPGRVHFILSNHELAEMTDYPIVKGHKLLNLLFRGGLHEEYGESACEVRDAQVAFLRSLPLGVRLPNDVLITHSCPSSVDMRGFDTSIFERELQPADLMEHGPAFQLVWGRDYRPENAEAFAKLMDARILIHGHDPCPTGCKVPNDTQIILDCCSRPAMYLLVPIDRSLTHADLVRRIERLP